MRRYAKLSSLTPELLKDILNYFFNRCDKVNIYFPNTVHGKEVPAVTNFKNAFLAATHIIENADELSSLEETLEEKEGFSMVIASLTEEVKTLILNMPASLHLDLGLIAGEKVLFYIGDENECVIEAEEDSDVFDSPLFNDFKTI